MTDIQTQVVDAVRRVQSGVRWKPGKGRRHLEKRIRQGHLPPSTTLAEYATIILSILSHPEAFVYVYQYGPVGYPTLVAPYRGRLWLAMFNWDGVMETAFPPDEPETYFRDDPKYIPLGSARELKL